MFHSLRPGKMNGGWASDDRNGFASPVSVLWWPACLYGCGCGHSLFSLEDVSKGQWLGPMNNLKESFDQMTMDISSQPFLLEDVRLPGAHGIGGFVILFVSSRIA